MKNKLFCIIRIVVIALLCANSIDLVACNQILATPAPTATPTPEAVIVDLIPFTSEAFRIQGELPKNWTEVTPGTYARMKSPEDPTAIYLLSFPHTRKEWLLEYIPTSLGLLEAPAYIGSYPTATLNWSLYKADANILGWNFSFDIALAENDSTLYAVCLLTFKEEYEALHQSIFLPLVDALKPVPLLGRDKLTEAELTASEAQGLRPVYNAYFAPLGEATPANAKFEGTLSVPGFKMSFKNIFGQPAQPGQDEFPGFTAQFFTVEGSLVPAQQDILPAQNQNSFWKVILSPGNVWSEAGDGDWSRAAFPFVLVSTASNETHNGLATFLYDDTQVSSFRFQVVQETAPSNKFDAWGQHTMSYTPGPVENQAALAALFKDELSHQVPIHPWSELEQKYDPGLLMRFTGRLDLYDISATGLILDGIVYLQPCLTRYGDFPYCQNMRHGVFSLTKSMGAAVAMLRLAEKYGDGVFDLKVSDYVTLTASHDGWKNVTFGDAQNQATGIGDDPSPEVMDICAEEYQPKWAEFTQARSAQEKLDIISTYGKYPWGPGKVARYNTTNIFVLAVAMDHFLKSKEGPQADIWDMVLEEVYKPIGIYHAPMMRTVEPDGSQGVPILGYGLYPTVEDMAKVALLIQDNGLFQGLQLLHGDKLAEAILRIEDTGLPTGVTNGSGFYHLSFWSEPYRSSQKGEFMVPYMSGFGGNRVVFNPNGIISFRFTDAADYDLLPLVKVADGIQPFYHP